MHYVSKCGDIKWKMDWYFPGRSQLVLWIVISGSTYETGLNQARGWWCVQRLPSVECCESLEVMQKVAVNGDSCLMKHDCCTTSCVEGHPRDPPIQPNVISQMDRGSRCGSRGPEQCASPLTCRPTWPSRDALDFPGSSEVYSPPHRLMTQNIIKESACQSAAFPPCQCCSFATLCKNCGSTSVHFKFQRLFGPFLVGAHFVVCAQIKWKIFIQRST